MFLTGSKYIKTVGYWALGFSTGTDVILSINGLQSWSETGINTSVTGIALSIGGLCGFAIQLHYNASKGYMRTLSRHPEWVLQHHIIHLHIKKLR